MIINIYCPLTSFHRSPIQRIDNNADFGDEMVSPATISTPTTIVDLSPLSHDGVSVFRVS